MSSLLFAPTGTLKSKTRAYRRVHAVVFEMLRKRNAFGKRERKLARSRRFVQKGE